MGDRVQAHIIRDKYHDIWLYGHWMGNGIIGAVRQTLAKHKRWDTPCYLTRMIFCEMVKGEEESEYGFGICNAQHGDVHRVIEVDCAKETVSIIYSGKMIWSGPFENFIKSDFDDWMRDSDD